MTGCWHHYSIISDGNSIYSMIHYHDKGYALGTSWPVTAMQQISDTQQHDEVFSLHYQIIWSFFLKWLEPKSNNGWYNIIMRYTIKEVLNLTTESLKHTTTFKISGMYFSSAIPSYILRCISSVWDTQSIVSTGCSSFCIPTVIVANCSSTGTDESAVLQSLWMSVYISASAVDALSWEHPFKSAVVSSNICLVFQVNPFLISNLSFLGIATKSLYKTKNLVHNQCSSVVSYDSKFSTVLPQIMAGLV